MFPLHLILNPNTGLKMSNGQEKLHHTIYQYIKWKPSL